MNHHRGSDGSFVRSVVVTLSQSETDRLMLFCELHRLMRTRAFGHNATFGDHMTRHVLLRMGLYRPTRRGRPKSDSGVRDASALSLSYRELTSEEASKYRD